jgi:3D-(3,5/4)-trihydroxycyclohexane-1,2-dione acylhydrolase (decyclizing)
MPLVSDAKVALEQISLGLLGHRCADPDFASREAWFGLTDRVFAAPETDGTAEGANALPSDGQVIGAVSRVATEQTVVMCAAGTMPGALQILWRAAPGGYHMEYGYSCMGYEVAGALGIKMAAPEREVICFVGDGSYMMANSELATAVMMRVPFTIVLTDNRGYGCINRLQQACGGAEFNNMYKDSRIEAQPEIDFVAHAAAMGAHAVKAGSLAELEAGIKAARERQIPTVLVIDTEAVTGPGVGGDWWDVAVPEVGSTDKLKAARERYEQGMARQRVN